MNPYRKGDKCEPAASIILKLGGVRALARELELDPSALSKWQTKTPRGSGGLIPSRYYRKLLTLAKQRRIPLRADNFIPKGRPA